MTGTTAFHTAMRRLALILAGTAAVLTFAVAGVAIPATTQAGLLHHGVHVKWPPVTPQCLACVE